MHKSVKWKNLKSNYTELDHNLINLLWKNQLEQSIFLAFEENLSSLDHTVTHMFFLFRKDQVVPGQKIMKKSGDPEGSSCVQR
jgi:hypothetical protein